MFYIKEMIAQLGIGLFMLFVLILIWSLMWKFLALWKAARKGSLIWFLIFALVNTMGILEILYIFVFSEKECCKKEKPKKIRRIKGRKKR